MVRYRKWKEKKKYRQPASRSTHAFYKTTASGNQSSPPHSLPDQSTSSIMLFFLSCSALPCSTFSRRNWRPLPVSCVVDHCHAAFWRLFVCKGMFLDKFWETTIDVRKLWGQTRHGARRTLSRAGICFILFCMLWLANFPVDSWTG